MDLLENPKLPFMLRRLNTKDFKKFDTFMWNGSHISAVVRFLQRSRSIDDTSIAILERLEASRNTSRFPRMVLSFTENLRSIFRVPKLQFITSDLLASFLDFLLDTLEEIVEYHSDLIDPVEDQIRILHKEMKFLIAILGDALFRCTEIDKTKKFLKEVEDVADEAGRFLYLYFFTDEGKQSRMSPPLTKLLKKFEQMGTKIREHCLTVSKLPISSMVPKTAVNSLFIVNSLVDDLEDLLNRDDDLIVDVWDEIETLQEELILLRPMLKVLKEQEIVSWIRDAAYEAEYLINSFVVGHVPTWYLNLRINDVIQKIKLLGIGLEEISRNYNDVKYLIDSFMVGDVPVWYLKLRNPDVHFIENIKVISEAQINAKDQAIDDNIVVGLDKEAEIIADKLVGGPKKLQVVTIFGMPGIGKTTLGKKLYNDPAVFYRFDLCAWSVVSETYNRRSLFVNILKSTSDLDRDKILSMDTESLGVELHKSLKGRRYLIVMDDIWNPTVWDDMRRYLPDDGNGSRTLLTTRVKEVAPSNSTIHLLPFLSNEQCWDLLRQKVFQKQGCPQELVEIGEKIATHCHGLPLAVVVIAAVLAKMEHKRSLWNEVAGSLSSQISKDDHKFMNILELSYKHLPLHLKPCFLYFGAFPEDSEILVCKLISLWIAEGFVQEDDQKSLREVAEQYLDDLIDRSLVLVAKRRSRGGVKACSIHDLLRELCLRKAEEENFLKLTKGEFSLYEKHHRLCIPSESTNAASRPFGLNIRSWLGNWSDISSIYSRLKLLRVLDLPTADDLDLSGIEQLVNLRYLAVRIIEHCIPPSIGCLKNLEFLLFDGPGSIEIPEALLDLVKLRHVHFRTHAMFNESCYKRAFMEKEIKMNSLESISNLWILHGNDEKILRCWPNLRRLKCATRALKDSADQHYRYLVLDHLNLLESLNITYLGSEFKFSDTMNFPMSLKKLTLREFKLSWNEMSMIGRLPKLQVLKLLYTVFDGKEWKTNDDEFQELEFLKLEALKIHRWNTSRDHFPKLRRLVMHKCWKLKKFPACFGDSTTLQIIDIHSCSKSVANSALQIQNEQLEMGNEEPKVIVSGSCW